MKIAVSLILSSVLFLISCKKNRSCTCTVNTAIQTTTHSQTAGTTISIPPLPPVVLTPASDTTYSSASDIVTSQKTDYHRVSKNTMNKNCASHYEETILDSSLVITPGTSTLSTQRSGTKTYSCKIE